MKRYTKLAQSILAGGVIAFCGSSLAEEVSGLLEKGRDHSALLMFSPESGDLIGYVVSDRSPLSKKLSGVCLFNMECELEGASVREYTGATPEGFQDFPVAWFEITDFKAGSVGTVDLEWQSEVQTRYGRVSVDEETSSLHFEGMPVQPLVEANSGLSIVMHYEIESADVLLVANSGGSWCPSLYRYVVVSPKGATATQEFGTCSDIIYPSFDGKHSFSVNMIGFAGPEEPEKVQRQAARTKHRFDYDSETSVILENGKKVE